MQPILHRSAPSRDGGWRGRRGVARLGCACIVVLMLFAAVFHARRPGEGRNIVLNLVIGLLAALVAYGRFFIAPLS